MQRALQSRPTWCDETSETYGVEYVVEGSLREVGGTVEYVDEMRLGADAVARQHPSLTTRPRTKLQAMHIARRNEMLLGKPAGAS